MALRVTRTKPGLSLPLLYAGVEETLFGANAAVGVLMVVSLGQYWFLGVSLALHFVLRGVSKKDHLAGRIYVRYAKQADIYTPWPSVNQSRGFRPNGFAREERLM